MAKLLPTTRAQVSGHQFMRRRMEHGLLFGDIRMIHDPLSARHRATVFGVAAVVMIAGVMGLFAWMRPNADPGDAPILRASDGTLYVRVDDTVHPVTNLSSARLIAGAAADPSRVGDEHLAAMPRGVPVGIVAAPAMFAPEGAVDAAWSVCAVPGRVTVVAGQRPEPLLGDDTVLATDGTRQWLVTGEGRQLLPDATTPHGRIVRRALGVGHTTPMWEPPLQVMTALKELPPVSVPTPDRLPEVLVAESGAWALFNGRIEPLSEVQQAVLLDAGAKQRSIGREQLATYQDGDLGLTIPERRPQWVDPVQQTVCVDQDRGGAVQSGTEHDGTEHAGAEHAGTARYGAVRSGDASAIALSGASVATHFAGLADGSIGVDSGHGFHVVASNGLRHRAPDAETLATVGAVHVERVPWEIVSLLPEGEELTRAAALTATY